MIKDAYISKDGLYRYSLVRIWDYTKPMVLFIGLNPSTADHLNDDPTMRREINFAKDWKYGGLYKVNLFAYRATNPKEMKKAVDPVGVENDYWISAVAGICDLILLAWGSGGEFRNRGKAVINLLRDKRKLHCLTKTKSGHPGHTLYLKKDLKPIEFTGTL